MPDTIETQQPAGFEDTYKAVLSISRTLSHPPEAGFGDTTGLIYRINQAYQRLTQRDHLLSLGSEELDLDINHDSGSGNFPGLDEIAEELEGQTTGDQAINDDFFIPGKRIIRLSIMLDKDYDSPDPISYFKDTLTQNKREFTLGENKLNYGGFEITYDPQTREYSISHEAKAEDNKNAEIIVDVIKSLRDYMERVREKKKNTPPS